MEPLDKLFYVAGKYRDITPFRIRQNIRKAEEVALKLWKNGIAVICPHKNTELFDGEEGKFGTELWLQGDLTMIARCDAIVMLDNWKDSEGAMIEYNFAKQNDIPVYFWREDRLCDS